MRALRSSTLSSLLGRVSASALPSDLLQTRTSTFHNATISDEHILCFNRGPVVAHLDYEDCMFAANDITFLKTKMKWSAFDEGKITMRSWKFDTCLIQLTARTSLSNDTFSFSDISKGAAQPDRKCVQRGPKQGGRRPLGPSRQFDIHM